MLFVLQKCSSVVSVILFEKCVYFLSYYREMSGCYYSLSCSRKSTSVFFMSDKLSNIVFLLLWSRDISVLFMLRSRTLPLLFIPLRSRSVVVALTCGWQTMNDMISSR